MPDSTRRPETLLPLLRDVSRSFYVSIRLLPVELREPIGVAYLLARATDTIADAPTADVEARQRLLSAVPDALEGDRPQRLYNAWHELGDTLAHAGERELMRRMRGCIAAFDSLSPADRDDVLAVLHLIVRGQSLDLQRFGGGAEIRALPDAESLREYTYLVAGCVGEFWTNVCVRHLPECTERGNADMRMLGRSFGCALQLVNIVRDAGEDLRAGRCYFPADELAAAGLVPADILQRPDDFVPLWHRWQDEAFAGLADGIAYAEALRLRRLRAAVALPAIVGARTLQLLRARGTAALGTRAKLPRHAMRALLLRVALGLAGRGALRTEWDNARR